MPYKDKQKQLLRNRIWKKNNKEKVNEIARNYRKKNLEKHRAYNKEYSRRYRKEHPEYIKMCNIKYGRPYRLKHKEELKKYQIDYIRKNRKLLNQKQAEYRNQNRIKIRIGKIKNKFKISFEQAEKLYIKAHTICDICGYSEKQKKALHIDHNHKTGKIRGVLCSRCNTSLGGFREDINIFKKAIDYLQQDGYAKL